MEKAASEPPDEFMAQLNVDELKATLEAEQQRVKGEQATAREAQGPPEQETADGQAPSRGRVAVLGSEFMIRHTVVLSGIPFADPELYGVMSQQTVDGRRGIACLFTNVPEGQYSVHQAANYAQIQVYGN